MRTGLTKAQKTTEITFDEKEPLIHIRTHNTATGCMEFSIRKGRLSFRLTAPYSEKRKRKASEAAKRNGFNRKP